MAKKSSLFINEGVLRIAIFIMLSSLTYTVRNYSWAVTFLVLLAIYSLVTGVFKLFKES
ncbi:MULTISPECIES: hypothetical protein [Bacillales]|uniref:Uncharacterized protein n=1 Tax=Paenibacillus agri TaxID=2744309 RepID=A0A850EJA8_9BACL|nr:MULTISPECIES: hypothetical protein [Bacillales]NUU61453.1 hypothetical protein [Paenibacillus agri]